MRRHPYRIVPWTAYRGCNLYRTGRQRSGNAIVLYSQRRTASGCGYQGLAQIGTYADLRGRMAQPSLRSTGSVADGHKDLALGDIETESAVLVRHNISCRLAGISNPEFHDSGGRGSVGLLRAWADRYCPAISEAAGDSSVRAQLLLSAMSLDRLSTLRYPMRSVVYGADRRRDGALYNIAVISAEDGRSCEVMSHRVSISSSQTPSYRSAHSATLPAFHHPARPLQKCLPKNSFRLK